MFKVIELTKDYFVLENGCKYERQFSVDEEISLEEFQTLLNKSEKIINEIINE